MKRIARTFRSSDGSIHDTLQNAQRKQIELEIYDFLIHHFPEIQRDLANNIAVKISVLRAQIESIFEEG